MSAGSDGLLAGRVIVVTGAANGIGRAVAESCARAGARLVLSDVGCDRDGEGHDPEAIRSVGRVLSASGTEIVTDDRDLRVRGVPADVVRIARERFGRLDGVVSCAGIVAMNSEPPIPVSGRALNAPPCTES